MLMGPLAMVSGNLFFMLSSYINQKVLFCELNVFETNKVCFCFMSCNSPCIKCLVSESLPHSLSNLDLKINDIFLPVNLSIDTRQRVMTASPC